MVPKQETQGQTTVPRESLWSQGKKRKSRPQRSGKACGPKARNARSDHSALGKPVVRKQEMPKSGEDFDHKRQKDRACEKMRNHFFTGPIVPASAYAIQTFPLPERTMRAPSSAASQESSKEWEVVSIKSPGTSQPVLKSLGACWRSVAFNVSSSAQ